MKPTFIIYSGGYHVKLPIGFTKLHPPPLVTSGPLAGSHLTAIAMNNGSKIIAPPNNSLDPIRGRNFDISMNAIKLAQPSLKNLTTHTIRTDHHP